MVPLCPVISTAQWAGFPDRLEMSCGPQGHAGHRLSLAVLLFTLGCDFIWLLHSVRRREKASLQCPSVIAMWSFGFGFSFFYLTTEFQFALWSHLTISRAVRRHSY